MNKTIKRWLCVFTAAVLFAPLWFGSAHGSSPGQWIVRSISAAVPDAAPEQASPPDPAPRSWHRFKASVGRLFAKIGVDQEAVKLYAKWVVGAPFLVVSILIAMLLRPRRKIDLPEPASRPHPLPVQIEKSQNKPVARVKSAAARPSRPAVKLPDLQEVLRFFLQLFKRQQNAEPDAPAQIVRTQTRPTCPDETYEMRILDKEEWITRRMSIGLLGQGGGSRSKCFYVIYDTHMVIKLPAVPMSRFSDYKRQVAAEGRIVERLAPRPCIVPRVSVILKAAHSIPGSENLSEEMLEARYMHLVETNPEYQEHLKIGDSFAFFMDLAKHYFLSTTMEEIHSGYGRLIDEAHQYPELLWDRHGFVCRYGEEAGAVCHALQDAYYRCEGDLRQLIEEAGLAASITTYHLKQWFLAHMVGETILRDEYELPAELIAKANQLLAEVVNSNQYHVDRYRQQLKEYIHQTRFSQYRRQVESLASSILDLLAWIRQKGLALRDLKPENLFVAGNPDEYPIFLNDPQKFSIGLIDVETAIPIDAEDPVLIPQPQLAGTPLYATPSHLMSNAILLEVYDDLGTILHLQDWHATIAILFKLITGEPLFGTTAHVFPEILSRLKVLDPAGPDMQEDVARIHGLYWNSAMAEFQASIAQHAATMARVEVAVPAALVDEILSELKSEINEIEKIVAKAVADQSFFNSGDKRRYLKAASSEKIHQMKNKLTQEMESGEGQQQSQVLLYFEILEKLKVRLETKQLAAATISAPNAAIAADQLLEVMFQKVLNVMYPSHWPALAPRLYGSSSFLATDITTYQATM